MQASATGAASYETPSGETKPLPCELAFDAGFTLARAQPNQTLATELTAAQVDALTLDCFNPETVTKPLHGLLAGAHHAKRPEPPRQYFLDRFED